ncbi:Phage protein [Collimonas arenae]|uniref:Phage protein n=1 Tax=Collimonas arenae TaxID=279058 RepID=A0A0A1F6Q8_9BURK|nr:hypothetical protein [Collimonas arenae]AIY40191.1 Phage protein [Collimonas arenae]
MQVQAPNPDLIEYVNRLEAEMCQLPQVNCPHWDYFAPGLYARQMFINKGVALTGAVHRTEHLCIISGDISVTADEGVKRITHLQKIISSKPGTKRAGYAHLDTYWTTVHATTETDLEKLVLELVEASSAELLGGAENKQLLHNRLKG